jgi:hypothetical protein
MQQNGSERQNQRRCGSGSGGSDHAMLSSMVSRGWRRIHAPVKNKPGCGHPERLPARLLLKRRWRTSVDTD